MQERQELTAERIRAIAEQFKDHWIAQPGQRGVKADWLATWRNWVRREKGITGGKALSVSDHNQASVAAWKAKRDKEETLIGQGVA